MFERHLRCREGSNPYAHRLQLMLRRERGAEDAIAQAEASAFSMTPLAQSTSSALMTSGGAMRMVC